MNTLETKVMVLEERVNGVEKNTNDKLDHIVEGIEELKNNQKSGHDDNRHDHGEIFSIVRSLVSRMELTEERTSQNEKKIDSTQTQVELVRAKQTKTDTFVSKVWVYLGGIALSGGIIGGFIAKYLLPTLVTIGKLVP